MGGDGEDDDQARSQFFSLQGVTIEHTLLVSSDSQKRTNRLLTGATVDNKYKIKELLGEGGMGAVYRAHHLLLNKDVALKTFKSSDISADSWQRFQREAQSTARLIHKNIVQVFDFGVGEDQVPYYTMECLEGESLSDRIKRDGILSGEEVIAIFLQVCHGLQAAHTKGIIHRDLTPANIFIVESETATTSNPLIKILDFGIAGLAQNSIDQKLTASGTIFGSPLYMSPEQSRGKDITELSDIYSCGCALYHALAGKPPFRGANALTTMVKHQESPVPSLAEASGGLSYPQRMDGLITRMLAKTPDKRIQSVQEVAVELEEIMRALHRSAWSNQQAHQSSKNNNWAERETSPDHIKASDQKTLPLKFAGAFIAIAVVLMVLVALKIVMPTSLFTSDSNSLAKKSTNSAGKNTVQIKPFLVSTNALGWRHFVFPADCSLGELNWNFPEPEYSHEKKGIAQNVVDVEPKAKIALEAGPVVAQKPELFSGFGPYDLNQLTLSSSGQWTDEVMPYIAKLSGLKYLDLSRSMIHAESIPSLDKLRDLKVLLIKKPNLTGENLAKLGVLPSLEQFASSDLVTSNELLQKFGHSQNLKVLRLDHCDMDDSGMISIAAMSNLESLMLAGDSGITDGGLKLIRYLKHLRHLELEHTSVTAASIPTLKLLPKLRELSIDEDDWSAKDSKRLRQELPLCKITAGADDPLVRAQSHTKAWMKDGPQF